jgi:hypothetical protein
MMEAGVRLYWQSDIPDDKEGMARFMALVYRVMSLAQHSRRAEVEEMLRTEREFCNRGFNLRARDLPEAM